MWRLLAVLLVSQQLSVIVVHGGSQIDESGRKCEEQGVECPRDADKSYKKYCCFETTGTVDCCNPYFALELGVGIGVPLVILIIISMVVTYCCCACRQRRRERTIYYGEYEDEEELVAPSSFKVSRDDELPPYSEADPFSEEPPDYSSTDPSTNDDNVNDNNVNN